MDALQLQAMSQLSRHQIQLKLSRIDAALLMFDAGKYGICRKCRFPLAFERLDAVPEAPFCMECQESMERT